MKKTTHSIRNIALLIRRDTSYGRDVMQGVGEIAREESWALHTLPPTFEILKSLQRVRPDGLISHLSGKAIQSAGLVFPNIPVVDVSQAPLSATPSVMPDNDRIGCLVAQHFLDRGLRDFAYIGMHDEAMDHPRRHGFERTVTRAGYTCQVYLARAYAGTDWERQLREDHRVARWLRKQGAPLGVFALTDETGAHLLRACMEAGLRVPGEVSVVGVHDDPMIVSLTRPPLSSVRTDPQQVGYQAACFLRDLLAGRSVESRPCLIPPVGVTVRESSDGYAVKDEVVQRALERMRGEDGVKLDVNTLSDELGVSRRTLERHFVSSLRITPAEELSTRRLEKAKRMLSDTNLSLAEVARRSGFASATRLCEAFRLSMSTTPTRYRQVYQRPAAKS